MCRRPLFLPYAVVLFAALAALPACKKKSTDTGSGGETPAPGPTGTPSASGSSDYILFAHLNAKDILESDLYAEVKAAVAKAGAKADWDKFEADAGKELGVKPTDIDSVAVFVTEVPKGKDNKDPKFVAILTTNKAIDKASAFKLGPQAKPDDRGFYKPRGEEILVHFPDAKTMAVLHPDLAQKYLDGYARSRTGWPMSAELTKAAAEHTLYAVARVNKLPSDLKRDVPIQQVPQAQALMDVKTIVVSADLNGKEVQFSALAQFPSPAAAGKAKESVKELLGMASGFIDLFAGGKEAKEFGTFLPAIREAKRTLKEVQIEVEGSDLVVNGSYHADFDIGAMVVEAVKQIRKSGSTMTAQNNLKQIGLALHNFSSATGQIPIHAVGAKGMPLRNASDKPLLSWRVALLPYMDQGDLYKQFKLDEPWDSPNNKKLIEQMPKIYMPVDKPGKPGYTHLQMVVGPNAMQVGMQFPGSFTDGLSNTIAVVEAAEPVIWTKPDDLMLPGQTWPKDFRKKFGGLQPGGFNVAMWDGSVRFLRDSVSDQILGLLLNPRDGQAIPPGW